MPSWPGSIFAPTVKSAGQTIQAAHVNDVQDEVVAMQTGWSDGTARLHSSNSTVANLTVSGDANLARVDISGGSTFSGVSVNGGSTFAVRPVTPPPEAAKVFLAATKDLGSSVHSTISFVSQDYLVNSSVHSTGTNPERLTPQSTGLFRFTGQVLFAGGPSANVQMKLRVRDSSGADVAGMDQTLLSAIGPAAAINVSAVKRFDVTGGHATLGITNQSGASTMSLAAGVAATWFAMEKL